MLMLCDNATSTYLGPARVAEVADRRARLLLHDQEFWAVVALAFPYQVTVGDTVLVIGQDDGWYVIGVLRGSGKTTLTVPGDLELRAPHGAIELHAARRVCLRGPVVRLAAGRLELVARSAWERFTRAARWVQETFRVQADRVLTNAHSEYRLKAGSIKEKADGFVQIDGEKILLG
jgi:hypothetical protein